MHKLTLAGIALMLCLSANTRAQDSYTERARRYIETYRDMAIAEQKRSGIPAAITLSQGIYETNAGASELATQANNHFGIKCKKDWTGETFAHTDDAPDECFRKYKCAADSYHDHSDYLKNSPRYKSCFEQSPTDYTAWATQLKKCGYATNPQYAQKLIRIIEDFKLQEVTYLAMNDKAGNAVATAEVVPDKDAARYEYKAEETTSSFAAATPQPTGDSDKNEEGKPVPDDATHLNGLKGFYARKGDVLLEQAISNHIRYARLLELNDLPDAPLASDMFIYLERKHSKGTHQQYIVQPGDKLQFISQQEGIQLRQLRTYNQLNAGEEPAPGTVLQLQQYATAKPAVLQQAAPQQVAAALPENTGSQDNYVATGNAPVSRTTAAAKVAAPAQQEEEQAQDQDQETAAPVAEIPSPAAPVANRQTAETPQAVAAAPAPAPVSSANSSVNIADEVAVAEQQPTAPAQPQDELSRLKARLDKAVYGQGTARKENTAAEPAATAPPQASQPEAVTAKSTQYYTVQKGDTAFSIARKHNISMKQLMQWNQLDFDAIKVGQKLKVSP